MLKLSELKEKLHKNKFLIIGRAGIDLFPDPPGTKTEEAKYFESQLGGSSANIAVSLTKLGGKCHLLTCVSEDALGRLAIKKLKNFGVNTSFIRYVKGDIRISFSVVETTIKNHQSIIFRNGAADLMMNKKDINQVDFTKFSCLIFTGTCLTCEPTRTATFHALKIAKKNHLPIVFDIDYRPYTWKSLKETSKIFLKAARFSDILIGNDDEFGILAGNYKKGLNIAKKLSNSSTIVVYKMGDRGSVTFSENNTIKTGVFNVKPIKPTGAGDAFMGGFISSLMHKKNIQNSLITGSASAAIVVTKVGCSLAMPNIKELQLFINKHKLKNFTKL
tara:strand:- start:248 stop:1243 length:996 start_codon:yes stop_codon:yes gene_type:complete